MYCGMSIFVRARFDVRPGHQADFERAVLELRERAAAEPGTVTYRWFSLPEPGGYLVIEEYADPAAAKEHNKRQAELIERVFACADLAFAEMYGTLDAGLRAWAEDHPQVSVFEEFPAAGDSDRGRRDTL